MLLDLQVQHWLQRRKDPLSEPEQQAFYSAHMFTYRQIPSVFTFHNKIPVLNIE